MKLNSYTEFKMCQAPLKDTSIDDSDNTGRGSAVFLSQITKNVVDFDRVKENYTKKLSISCKNICSVDALFQNKDNYLFFVEFKNGEISLAQIKHKVRDTLLIFNSITEKQIDFTRTNAKFILVVNDERIEKQDSKKKKAMYMARKTTKKDFADYGLENMRGYLFDKVDCLGASAFDKWVATIL